MTDMQLRPADLDNLAGLPNDRGHMSHSSISMQLSCLRKWGWAYDEKLELISKPRPLGMGSAFHKAIELGDPVAGVALLDRPTVDQEDFDRVLMDKAIVTGAAKLYLDTYGTKGLERELEYRVRLRSPYTGAYSRTFDLLGFADGVIDHGSYLELIEMKFVGRVDPVTVKRVKLDRQVSLECYALWRVTGKPVRVIRYRWTKKPSIKQKQKETVSEYCERVIEDYAQRPDFYAIEEKTFRSDDDLLLIEAELWDWAEQLRDAKRRNVFARNTSHCTDFGGCPYIDLCVGDPDARALYRKKEHAPE